MPSSDRCGASAPTTPRCASPTVPRAAGNCAGRAARQHELHRAGTSPPARARTPRPRASHPAPAARAAGRLREALHVALEVPHAAVLRRHGLEDSVPYCSPRSSTEMPRTRHRSPIVVRSCIAPQGAQQAAGLGASFLNSDSGASPQQSLRRCGIRPPVAHGERADEDVEVQRPVAPEITHRARVGVARRPLESPSSSMQRTFGQPVMVPPGTPPRWPRPASRRRAARRARSTRCGAPSRRSRWS